MAVLEVTDLVCSFRNANSDAFGGERKAVLNGVTFTVDDGSCVGLIGDSGSGKSTIARCVAGLTVPDAGRIAVKGVNVFPDVRNRRSMPGAVQMLFQDHTASLDPIMTVRESLAEGVRASADKRRADDREIAALLGNVGLDAGYAGRYPAELSGGERQRVALARALSVHPALLVLDEPTSALDAVTQVQILDLVASAAAATKSAMLFISHDIAAIARICSHIAVLSGGTIVEYGTSAGILAYPRHEYTKRIAALASR